MDVKKTVIKQYNGSDYDNIIPTAKTNNVLMQNNNVGVNNVDKCMDYLSNNISQTGRLYTPNNIRIPYIELYNPVSGARYVFSYKFNTSSVTTSPFSFNIIQTNGTEAIITDSIYVDVIYHKGYIYYCKAIPSSNYIGRTDAERLLGFSKVRIILYKVSASYNSINDIFNNATTISEYTTYMTTKDMSYLRRSIRLIPCGNGVGLTILSVRIIYDNNSHYYAIENTIKVYNVGYDTSELVFDVTYRDDGFESVDFEVFLHFFRGLSIAKLRAGIYIVYSDICRNIKMPYFMIFTTHNIEVFAKYYSTDLDTLRMLEPDSTSNLIFCYYINQQSKLGQEFLSIDYDENTSNIYLGSMNTSPYSNTQLLYSNASNIYEKIILKKNRNCYIMSNVLNADDYALYYQKMSKSAILDYPKNISNNDAKVFKLKNANDNSFSVYYPYVIDSFYNNFRINNIIYNNTAENKSCFITIKI